MYPYRRLLELACRLAFTGALIALAAAVVYLALGGRVAEAPMRTLPVRDVAPVEASVDYAKNYACPDLALLAQVIHAEARGEPFAGQVAVAAVVVNRVADPRWPADIEAVITEPGQFVISRGGRGPGLGYHETAGALAGRWVEKWAKESDPTAWCCRSSAARMQKRTVHRAR